MIPQLPLAEVEVCETGARGEALQQAVQVSMEGDVLLESVYHVGACVSLCVCVGGETEGERGRGERERREMGL